MWSQQRTGVANQRALYESFEMDGNTSGRKGRPSFRALSQMGYSFVGNQKTPDSKDHWSSKTTKKSQVNGYAYDTVTTRKSHTTTNSYEIKTRRILHTPTYNYEKATSKPFTRTHRHTETTRLITTRKLHTTTNAYEIGTRKPHPPTYDYEQTTAKPFTTTHQHTDTIRLITATKSHATTNAYEVGTTRKPHTPAYGYENTKAKSYTATQTDTSPFSQSLPPSYAYEKTTTKPYIITHLHTDTNSSSNGYKTTSNRVNKIHHIGTKLYSMDYSKTHTNPSHIVPIRKPHTTANAYEIGTTMKPHPPTYGYEKTTAQPHTPTHRHSDTTTNEIDAISYGYERSTAKTLTTHQHTDTTRLNTTRKSHTTTNAYEIKTTRKPHAATYDYERTTAKPYTTNHSDTSTLSLPHTPIYAYEKTTTRHPHIDKSKFTHGYGYKTTSNHATKIHHIGSKSYAVDYSKPHEKYHAPHSLSNTPNPTRLFSSNDAITASNSDSNNEYDWWLYDTTARGSVNDQYFKSAKPKYYNARRDTITGYYSKAPITWYDESSKSNTEYNFKVSSRATKRISGYHSRKTNEYNTPSRTAEAQTSRITKDENGNQGY